MNYVPCHDAENQSSSTSLNKIKNRLLISLNVRDAYSTKCELVSSVIASQQGDHFRFGWVVKVALWLFLIVHVL